MYKFLVCVMFLCFFWKKAVEKKLSLSYLLLVVGCFLVSLRSMLITVTVSVMHMASIAVPARNSGITQTFESAIIVSLVKVDWKSPVSL